MTKTASGGLIGGLIGALIGALIGGLIAWLFLSKRRVLSNVGG